MSLRVGLVTDGGTEGAAALAWLTAAPDVVARGYPAEQVASAIADSDVVWLHGDVPAGRVPADTLRAWVAAGGGLLLTLRAASLVGALGLETVPPNDCRERVWSHADDEWWTEDLRARADHPHLRGLATYGPHPLVEGLHRGTYCWAPSEGESYAWACYSGGAWPAEGQVVAVERAFRIQNPERVVAWEYALGRGRVLCLGAFVGFAAPDGRRRPHLERLVRNALDAVAGSDACGRTWWPSPGAVAAASEALALPEPLDFDGALPVASDDPLVLAGAVEHDEAFDLAGRRALLLGGEQRGVREMWVHPHRVAASWTVRADGEVAVGSGVEITPDVVSRTVQTADRRLHETLLVALEHPVVLLEYRPGRKRRESVGRGPVDFEIEFVTDLRRTWPFAAGCGGNLTYRSRSDGRVAMVASESEDGVMAVFVSRAATVDMEAVALGAPAVRCRIRTTLGSPLFVAVVGGASQAELQRTLRGIRRLGVAGLVRQRSQRATVIAEARLALRVDDGHVERAFEWAKRRLDAFLCDVPGLGRSLLAGHAVSAARPAEAWLVSADACWASFGLLAGGEYSLVRQVIRFLGDRQDVTGQVPQEVTTSGQFEFAATDATPLYLLLVARYLAWSGDRDFVASIWPHVERALAFCLAADRDGCGLVPDGGAAPGRPRLSLVGASLWQAALRGVARAAEVLGEDRLAADCWARAARATAAIEDRFFDAERGAYAHAIDADGAASWSGGASHAVPLLLGATNPVRGRRLLEALAGEAVSTRWGVRSLPLTDPRFNAAARDGGSVRPVGTGWTALAEYRSGLGDAGFRHLRANTDLAYARSRGAFDEALDGLEPRTAGGCPDHAASAAMVVLPFVEGLLGAEPDAPAGKLALAPQLPAAWAKLEVLGLRCADSAYDIALQRRERTLEVALRRTIGPGLAVTVAPWLPSVPASVEVDGAEVRPEVTGWGSGVRCAVAVPAANEHRLAYRLK